MSLLLQMLMGRGCTDATAIYSYGGQGLACTIQLNSPEPPLKTCLCAVLLWSIVTGDMPVRGRLREVKCVHSVLLCRTWSDLLLAPILAAGIEQHMDTSHLPVPAELPMTAQQR